MTQSDRSCATVWLSFVRRFSVAVQTQARWCACVGGQPFLLLLMGTQMFNSFIEERIQVQSPDWFDSCVGTRFERVRSIAGASVRMRACV